MKRLLYNKMLLNRYQIVINKLLKSKPSPIDTRDTIPLVSRAGVPGSSRRLLGAGYCLLAATLTFTELINPKIDPIKAYGFSKVHTLQEMGAMNELYNRESNWNPLSRNGSHYGICQGKSIYLKNKSFRTQLDWCHKYIVSRYNGSYVQALNHWRVYGWH